MLKNKNKFSKLCRSCMEKGEIDIFATLHENQTLAGIIEKCFSFKISLEDTLPKTICQQCLDKIVSFHSFILNFHKNQAILQETIEDIKESETELIIIDFVKSESGSEDDKPLSQVLKKTKIKPFRHSTKYNHACSDCGEKFGYLNHLERHCKENGHAYPRRFACEVCLKKFVSKTRLKEHMRIHNKERPFECDLCKMTFTLSTNLNRHKKLHTGEKSFFCQTCGKGFIQKHTLTIHMRLHNGETPFVCELCGKGYRTKQLLHQHMFKHNDAAHQSIKYQANYLKYGKAKVECKECKKIITKSALYNHMKMLHGDGLKNFLCNLCGKTYTTKVSLDVHMNVHTKRIAYDCPECAKSFTHQTYLKTHLMMHSGERPHCCDICGKTFVQRSHLHRHMRTHTGARPYKCTYCEKTFALNENLKVHVRIHTGETPHHCLVCGKGFFNTSSRKKHETSVHRMHQKN